MVKNIISKHCRLFTALMTVVLTMTGMGATASAENKVEIADFNIRYGETKSVDVCLTNDDLMGGLQMDIHMPDELRCDPSELTRNDQRISRESHSIYMQEQNARDEQGRRVYKLLILPVPFETADFAGNSGALVSFPVTAVKEFSAPVEIEVTDIYGSSSHADPETGLSPRFDMQDYTCTVSPDAGRVFFETEKMAMKTDGSFRKVSVMLNNNITVRGMQAVITLPQGVTIETREGSDKPKFEYGERVPQNLSITSSYDEEGRLHIIMTGITTESIEGSNGMIFAFNVKADESLPLTSEITMSDIVLADKDGSSFHVDDDNVKVELTNSFMAHYTPAMETIGSLRTKLQETKDAIDEQCPDVKDSQAITDAENAVAQMIDDLQAAVENAYNDYTLADSYENLMATATDIEAAITKLLEDALKAQEDYTTGISSVTSDKEITGIYSITGEEVTTTVKGNAYIVKYSDGSVRKIFVK